MSTYLQEPPPPEDPLWTRWLQYANGDLKNDRRRMFSSPQLLRHIVDEETKPLHVEIEALRAINDAWIRDWEAIAEAAGEASDIMVASLRGRIVNMRARAARASEYRALLQDADWTLAYALELLSEHCDEDADPEDTSPEDSFAFQHGLLVQDMRPLAARISAALEKP